MLMFANLLPGANCGSGLKCASGQCTSRDQQCQTVMGQYSNLNDTRSCDNTNCQLTCASPEFGQNVCFGMQQNFLDGTPCSGDGTCKNGMCSGSTPLGEVKSWIERVYTRPFTNKEHNILTLHRTKTSSLVSVPQLALCSFSLSSLVAIPVVAVAAMCLSRTHHQISPKRLTTLDGRITVIIMVVAAHPRLHTQCPRPLDMTEGEEARGVG